MEFGWPKELEDFRDELAEFIRTFESEHPPAENSGRDDESTDPRTPLVRQALREKGWLNLSTPKEEGGEGLSSWYQYILGAEFGRSGLSFGLGVAAMIVPAIETFGTDEQKRLYLPGLRDGSIVCALGYSEPNAGTDLASLETAGTRDGDDWLINGQKLWTSAAHTADHVWLAVRTDPDAPKHRGISMFIVPLSAPGITVRPVYTMANSRTNEVFFEDVRVPDRALIGEPGRGWYLAANALDHERVVASTANFLNVLRLAEGLLGYMSDTSSSAVERLRLAEMVRDLNIGRALVLQNACLIADGQTPTMEASMAKVWISELRYKVSTLAMDLLGDKGRLSASDTNDAPIGGLAELTFRLSPRSRFAAGTNEVQRDIIARRGLGLPR